MTTTFYRSTEELRFKLACLMIEKAKDAGYPVVVVDGSPTPDVAQAFCGMGAMVFPEVTRGVGGPLSLGPSRRLACFLARELAGRKGMLGVITYVWLEPEKHDLIRLMDEFVFSIKRGEANVAVLGRSEKSWQTYPAFQRETEAKANEAFAAVTGRQGLDPMSGPMAFDWKAFPLFLGADGREFGVEDGYIHQIGLIRAIRQKLIIRSVELDFRYPPEQKAEEEGPLREAIEKKRMVSLSEMHKP